MSSTEPHLQQSVTCLVPQTLKMESARPVPGIFVYGLAATVIVILQLLISGCSQLPDTQSANDTAVQQQAAQNTSEYGAAVIKVSDKSGEEDLPSLPVASIRAVSETVAADEAITVQFIVENKTAVDLKVLIWGTPLESELTSPIIRVYRVSEGSSGQADEQLQYLGLLVKRGQPIDADYLLIESGKSVANRVSLDNSYEMAKPDKYKIELAPLLTTDNDTFIIGEAEMQLGEHTVVVERLP